MYSVVVPAHREVMDGGDLYAPRDWSSPLRALLGENGDGADGDVCAELEGGNCWKGGSGGGGARANRRFPMRNISSDDELLGSVTKVSTLCGAQVEYMATLMNRNFTRHPVKREQPSPCNIKP